MHNYRYIVGPLHRYRLARARTHVYIYIYLFPIVLNTNLSIRGILLGLDTLTNL